MAKSQKRQRKKEQRRAKIEEEIRRQQALRRRRVIMNLVLLGVVAGLIAAFIFRARQDDADTVSPTATASPEGGGVACGGEPIERESPPPTFAEPPAMSIDTSKTYTATIETSCGTVVVELADDQSPNTVNSFVFLAREGFYDGLIFHRVVPGFAVQGGDPKGTGSGGPGYQVVDVPPTGFKYVQGTVAMAKAGQEPPGTSGSQFFLVPGSEAESLPPDYAVLGTVVSGQDVLEKIQEVPTGEPTGERPVDTVYIVKITIEES